MKKVNLVETLLAALFLGILSVCVNIQTFKSEGSPEQAVADFYKSNYKYKSTQVQGGTVGMIVEGEVIFSPYSEYVHALYPEEENAWMEIYYTGEDDDAIDARINTPRGGIETKVKRSYPFGHGQELKYVFDRKETVRGEKASVYKTHYEFNLAETYGFEEAVKGYIDQEYYISGNKLLQIVTDLTDLREKTNIGNMMSTQGCSFEEAKEESDSNREAVSSKEILEIYQE